MENLSKFIVIVVTFVSMLATPVKAADDTKYVEMNPETVQSRLFTVTRVFPNPNLKDNSFGELQLDVTRVGNITANDEFQQVLLDFVTSIQNVVEQPEVTGEYETYFSKREGKGVYKESVRDNKAQVSFSMTNGEYRRYGSYMDHKNAKMRFKLKGGENALLIFLSACKYASKDEDDYSFYPDDKYFYYDNIRIEPNKVNYIRVLWDVDQRKVKVERKYSNL